MKRMSGFPYLRNSGQGYFLQSLHGKNHPGGNSLAESVQLKYIFPRLVSVCREYVFKCPNCQRLARKTAQCHTYGYDLVGSPGEKVCLDFVGPLKLTKKGHTSLLTIVNVYTGWFTAWPVKNHKAETVIKHLVRNYFPDRGVPSVVHSDNGPAFMLMFFKSQWQLSTFVPLPLQCTTTKATLLSGFIEA